MKRQTLKLASQFGLRPRSWNCSAQFGLGSRRRSMLMPRGNRPATAAFTSDGAGNANDSVRLIWWIVHRSRFASCSTSLTAPVTMSSSQGRPRAIVLTRRASFRALGPSMFSDGSIRRKNLPESLRRRFLPRDRQGLGLARWLGGP